MGAGSRTPAVWRAQSRDAVGVHCGDPAAKVAMATVQHRASHGIIGGVLCRVCNLQPGAADGLRARVILVTSNAVLDVY